MGRCYGAGAAGLRGAAGPNASQYSTDEHAAEFAAVPEADWSGAGLPAPAQGAWLLAFRLSEGRRPGPGEAPPGGVRYDAGRPGPEQSVKDEPPAGQTRMGE